MDTSCHDRSQRQTVHSDIQIGGLGAHRRRPQHELSHSQARSMIFDCIGTFCNSRCRHRLLGYLSLAQFEQEPFSHCPRFRVDIRFHEGRSLRIAGVSGRSRRGPPRRWDHWGTGCEITRMTLHLREARPQRIFATLAFKASLIISRKSGCPAINFCYNFNSW